MLSKMRWPRKQRKAWRKASETTLESHAGMVNSKPTDDRGIHERSLNHTAGRSVKKPPEKRLRAGLPALPTKKSADRLAPVG
jgi:hypothetical protein